MPQRSPFDEVQREYFDLADEERFEFLTTGPGFSETEDALLAPFADEIQEPFLEVGCGEGGNLARLARCGRCVGVDLFLPKVRFAHANVNGPSFAAANGLALPFRDDTFQTVFIRDVLHHIDEPRGVLREAERVLRPGGQLLLIEPNGRNPIVKVQALVVAAEGKSREFNTEHIRELLSDFEVDEVATAHPFPLRRVCFHYRFGYPRLAEISWTRNLLTRVELFVSRFVPPRYWEHVTAKARKRSAPRRNAGNAGSAGGAGARAITPSHGPS